MLKNVFRPSLLTLVLLLSVFAVASANTLWDLPLPPADPPAPTWWTPIPPAPPKPVRWDALFKLERSITYKYELDALQNGRSRQQGTLTLTVAGAAIQFEYAFGNKRLKGTAPNDPHGLAGAILLQAMSPLHNFSETEMQLMLAPLRFIEWYGQFAKGDFNRRFVWEMSETQWVRFDAGPVSYFSDGRYEGTVMSGSQSLLRLMIDLDQPLPVRVATTEGRWEYTALLRTSRQWSPWPGTW